MNLKFQVIYKYVCLCEYTHTHTYVCLLEYTYISSSMSSWWKKISTKRSKKINFLKIFSLMNLFSLALNVFFILTEAADLSDPSDCLPTWLPPQLCIFITPLKNIKLSLFYMNEYFRLAFNFQRQHN